METISTLARGGFILHSATPSAKGETDLGESLDAPGVTNANKGLEQAESHMPLWPLRSELAL